MLLTGLEPEISSSSPNLSPQLAGGTNFFPPSGGDITRGDGTGGESVRGHLPGEKCRR